MKSNRKISIIVEKKAEELVRKWLLQQGITVCKNKGDDVDIEGCRGSKVWLVEVKGDHVGLSGKQLDAPNGGALRNGFLTGLGQALVAKTRNPTAKVCLALTGMYRRLVHKYADVLIRQKFSVLWVGGKVIKEDKLRPGGHPDGKFECGKAKYIVKGGRLVEVRLRGEGKVAGKMSFAGLCRVLKIDVGRNAASRVLAQRSRPIWGKK